VEKTDQVWFYKKIKWILKYKEPTSISYISQIPKTIYDITKYLDSLERIFSNKNFEVCDDFGCRFVQGKSFKELFSNLKEQIIIDEKLLYNILICIATTNFVIFS